MNIEVKGINGVLLMRMNQNIAFQTLLEELDTLLDQPIFMQDGYFPRAFFDFGCREVQDDEMKQLISLLQRKRRILFDGISLPYHHQKLELIHDQVRNGEEIYIFHGTLFLGVVNPGSYVYCYDNVYFLNSVKGTIIGMKENIKIYGHDFQNAQIVMNQQTLHDLTTSALTSVYYKDSQICTKKEDTYEQNDCHYVR